MVNGNKSNFIGKVVWPLVMLSLACSLVVPNGHSLAAVIILILSPVLLLKKYRGQLTVSRNDKLMILAFLAYFLFSAGFIALDEWQVRELDRPFRFLVAIPLLVMLLVFQGRQSLLWWGVTIGSILAFFVGFYERFYLGYSRASNGMVAIMFGDTAMLLGLISAVSAMYYLSQKQKNAVVFALLSALCGIGASFLSGSRGGWIALPLIGFFIVWQSRDLISRRSIIAMLSVFCLMVVALLCSNSGVMDRINAAFHNIKSYLDGDPNTSVGLRFEMWKASFYMFMDSPLFGVGESNLKLFKAGLAAEGVISDYAVRFGHAHNEFLDFLSKRGLAGVLLLVMIYLVPLKLFLNKMHEYKGVWRVKAYAMAGALVPMCYIDFGLTQAMFSHNIGVVMYAFTLVYFWAAVRWAEKEYAEGLAPETLKANKSD